MLFSWCIQQHGSRGNPCTPRSENEVHVLNSVNDWSWIRAAPPRLKFKIAIEHQHEIVNHDGKDSSRRSRWLQEYDFIPLAAENGVFRQPSLSVWEFLAALCQSISLYQIKMLFSLKALLLAFIPLISALNERELEQAYHAQTRVVSLLKGRQVTTVPCALVPAPATCASSCGPGWTTCPGGSAPTCYNPATEVCCGDGSMILDTYLFIKHFLILTITSDLFCWHNMQQCQPYLRWYRRRCCTNLYTTRIDYRQSYYLDLQDYYKQSHD